MYSAAHVSRPARSVWESELAVLDVETTGLDADGADRVIEIAVVRGRVGETPRVWNALVDPGRPVAATHIHGITDAMVRGQPRFGELLPAIEGALGGALPCAHNAPFDLNFLRCEYRRAGATPPVDTMFDTLGLARRFFGLPSNSLDSLCTHFAIGRTRAHRAADDALATWSLAWRMLDVIDPDRAWTVDEALRCCRRRTAEELKVVRDYLTAAQVRATPVVVEYHAADNPGGGRTRRTITVRAVRSDRVVAFCHLRDAERTFRLDRLHVPAQAPADA